MALLLPLALAALGFTVGWSLPDVDQALWFTVHRSFFTHSFVLPLLIYLAARGQSWLAYTGAGACAALTIHLFLDLFPQAWRGYALLHAPLIGRFNQFWSVTFLLSGVVCAAVCAWLLVSRPRLRVRASEGA